MKIDTLHDSDSTEIQTLEQYQTQSLTSLSQNLNMGKNKNKKTENLNHEYALIKRGSEKSAGISY